MLGLPRRRLEELAAIYTLERSLRDIFVEGPTDRSFFRWYMDKTGRAHIHVYDASDIDIGDDREFDVNHGNKVKIVQLASFLQELSEIDEQQATCIVDNDLDRLLNIDHSSNYLLYTDFTCIEMYVCDEAAIEKFIRIYCRDSGLRSTEVLPSIVSVCTWLFALRLAIASLNIGCQWVDNLNRSLSYSDGQVQIDQDRYLNRLLSSGNCHADRDRIVTKSEEFEQVQSDDKRHFMHGHDVVRVLAYYFQKRIGPSTTYNEFTVSRALLLCAEDRQLADYPLFETLAHRLAG